MTREEIIEAIQNDDMMPFLQDWEARDVVDFVLKNYRPSLPSDLDEAAEKSGLEYAPIISGEAMDSSGQYYETDDVDWPSRCGFIKGFKAGAEWLARQGETLDSLIWRDEDNKLFIEAFVDENKFKMADNVTIQIRKKQ